MNAIRLPEWIVKTRIEALEFDEIENFLWINLISEKHTSGRLARAYRELETT